MKELPWIQEARKYIYDGKNPNGILENTSKTNHNTTLLTWLKDMGKYSKESRAWWADDETPWCGLFVGHVLGVSGRFVIKNWFRAKEWLDPNNMTKLKSAAYGCIGVTSRTGGGHVFFIVGESKDGKYFMCLGGNQNNRVNIMPILKTSVNGFYWPSIWDGTKCVKSNPAQSRYTLPILSTSTKAGGSMA